MSALSDIVITGVGIASPLGIGWRAQWDALSAGRSGIGQITSFDASTLPVRLVGEVPGFDPLQYVKPRKSIKVMARDAQLAITVAGLAREHSGLKAEDVDPERFGVVLGADTIQAVANETAAAYRDCLVDGKFHFDRWGNSISQLFPLGMLKLLPNMLACHISIAQDARGPNNTIYNGEVSSLLALGEAAAAIGRGQADVMMAGGASSRMQPLDWVRSCLTMELSRRNDEPAKAVRPFDRSRDGQVRGEGGAVLMLESRKHAVARGANVMASLLSWSSGCDPRTNGTAHPGVGLRRAIRECLRQAGLTPADIGHVNAHGLSTKVGDRHEAEVLAELLPGVPVTAPKSYFGNLAAAGGAVEAVASLLAMQEGLIPPTLNYEQPDPECPISVVHGEPAKSRAPYVLLINQTLLGQAAAAILGPAD